MSPTSGSNDVLVTIGVEENEELTSRNGEVVISDGESLTQTITVKQAGYVGTEIKLNIVDAIASTEQTDGGNIADNVYDGDLTNRWSGEGDGAYINLDLGEQAKVSFLKVGLFKGDERNTYFDIQTSVDGTEYFDALMDITSEITEEDLVIYDFADTTAQYVRIVGHGNSNSSWNSFTEFEVWGWEIERQSSELNKAMMSEVEIYPNPTSGSVTINLEYAGLVTIFDIHGSMVKILKSNGASSCEVDGLAPGTYSVVVRTSIGSQVNKLIVF